MESTRSDSRARILVAEDDPAMRQLVVEALQKDGHIVEAATCGREALARVTLDELMDWQLDLIVSDVRMPGVTGFQILETLRATCRTIPAVLMTAFGDAEMRARAKKLGAVLVDKPFLLEELRACVGKLLDGRDAR
jgi:CheY-like chemotaxis protein